MENKLITNEELQRIDERFRKTEEEGLKNLLKHFDRIHDKLFSFNNILIAGYFSLSKFQKSISIINILVPIVNLAFLLLIEYRMLEKSRFEASMTKKPLAAINKYGKDIDRTTLYSLLSIISTGAVTLLFLYYSLR